MRSESRHLLWTRQIQNAFSYPPAHHILCPPNSGCSSSKRSWTDSATRRRNLRWCFLWDCFKVAGNSVCSTPVGRLARISFSYTNADLHRTGDNRFRLPVPIDAYNGTQTAIAFGPSCPQQALTLPIPEGLAQDAVDYIVNSIYGVVIPDSEDCKLQTSLI